MSLYYVQKFLYQINREPALQQYFRDSSDAALADYDLTEEERAALMKPDIGLLYVLGVNGQLLMHYAAFAGYEWNAYLQAMRAGVARYGPVRGGFYAMTTGAPP